MSHRPALPPHLEDEEAILARETAYLGKSKIGPQGPSKYGKGGSRLHKALGRSKRPK
jgi:hypothetical protein